MSSIDSDLIKKICIKMNTMIKETLATFDINEAGNDPEFRQSIEKQIEAYSIVGEMKLTQVILRGLSADDHKIESILVSLIDNAAESIIQSL